MQLCLPHPTLIAPFLPNPLHLVHLVHTVPCYHVALIHITPHCCVSLLCIALIQVALIAVCLLVFVAQQGGLIEAARLVRQPWWCWVQQHWGLVSGVGGQVVEPQDLPCSGVLWWGSGMLVLAVLWGL